MTDVHLSGIKPCRCMSLIHCSCGATLKAFDEPHGCTVSPRGIDPAWAKREERKEPSQPQAMEYCIQSAPDPTTLTEHVRVMLKGGWVPQGGVSSFSYVDRDGFASYEFHQAMVRVGGGVGGAPQEGV